MDDLDAIVRDLAASNPVHSTGWDEAYEMCGLCEADNRDVNNRDIVLVHAESCPWLQAVAWVRTHPAPQETEGG